MIEVVVGGQFGSEGKGHVAAQLVRRLTDRDRDIVLVRVAGPNAGHSAVDANGRKWALRQIPVGAVVNTECPVVLGAGSEIDLAVLDEEIIALEDGGIPILNRLAIDSSATVIEPAHLTDEVTNDLTTRIGSTGKGVGAARADRIWRTAPIFGNWRDTQGYVAKINYHANDVIQDNTAAYLQAADYDGASVIIEGTQGYGLGFHTEWYPYCTSSDCTAQAFMSMAGVLPINGLRVWVVFRTYPIRVAGNSGSMFAETSWEWLAAETGGHVQPERTTVTKKIRRVGLWDDRLARLALEANGAPVGWEHSTDGEQHRTHLRPCLMFADYILPEIAGATTQSDIRRATEPGRWLGMLAHQSPFATIGTPAMYGTGPDTVVWDESLTL